ncbi:MAG: methylmalonyl-CoA mutase family protein [Pseudolabrys sp.]
MSDKPLPLAAEFPATSDAEWRKLVEAALKGADFDKKLVSRTYDGLRVEPLYARASGANPVAGRAAVPWQVMARVDHPDPVEANKQALIDLENGATGLTLVFGGSAGAYGYGIDGKADIIAKVLDGVFLDAGVTIEFDLSTAHRDAGTNLAALVKSRGVDPKMTQIRFGLDPLGNRIRAGSLPAPAAEIDRLFGRMIGDLIGQGFKGPFAAADGRCIHAAGGSEAQELAFAIASAVHYLRALETAGIAPGAARKLIFFRLAADADEFLTIAKFRALRKLWARVEDACGLTPEPAFVAAETAWRMMTQRDPYVNMLRTTIAVTAAGLGGADSIAALPFTQALGLPDAFARRVARNMQLILLEESNLYRVADPAAGAGGIEALTSQIAQAAWGIFQDIEQAGGAAAALENNIIQKKVAETRTVRQAAIAKRRDALTGASDYPLLSEASVQVLPVKPVVLAAPPAVVTFEALPQTRLADPFEALRDVSDKALKTTGLRPRVFLANLGRVSDFTARATFAKNFYEAGGIEALGNDGYKSRDEMIAAYKKGGAKLACLCSSDKVYEAEAVDAAKALAAAGATVHLAGRPGTMEAALKSAGVSAFIYVGCDALSTLQATHDKLILT